MDFVVDSSVMLAWLMPDERSESVQALLSGEEVGSGRLCAPDLIQTEVLNAVAVACLRRNRISKSLLEVLLDEFVSFGLVLDTPRPLSYIALVRLMARYGLSAYDARYLELALRIELPIATLDRKLSKAAVAEGLTSVC